MKGSKAVVIATLLLGETYKSIYPTMVSIATILVMNTIQNGISVAFGKVSKN